METQREMQAVVIVEYGGPECLQLRTNVKVPVPNANQVLIRMHAAGINTVDTRIRHGKFLANKFQPQHPMGLDGAGIVEQIGAGVSKFQPGDRVFTVLPKSGTYAQYALGNESNVYHLHESLSFQEGAVLGIPYFTACRALLKRGKFEKGEAVLIQGASGQVGLACINIVKGLGASLIVGTAGTEKGRNVALKAGADVVIDYKSEDFKDQLKKAFSDKEIDLIIETNSDINMSLDLDIIGTGGRIVIVGKMGETTCDPSKLMSKEATIMGSGLRVSTEEERNSMGRFLYQAASEGWLHPHVNQVYNLSETAKAHWDMENTKGASGKSIIIL